MITADKIRLWEKEFREKIKYGPHVRHRLDWLAERINKFIKEHDRITRYNDAKNNLR